MVDILNQPPNYKVNIHFDAFSYVQIIFFRLGDQSFNCPCDDIYLIYLSRNGMNII